MKPVLIALSLGAGLVAATPAPAHAKLVVRQDATNTTRFGQCQSECSSYATLETTCGNAGSNGNETATYECVCNAEFFNAAKTCGTCAPDAFANATIAPGLDGFIEVGVATCSENGFQVVLGTASSGPSSGGPRPTPVTDTDGNSTDSSVMNTLVGPTTRASNAVSSVLSSGASVASAGASSAASAASSAAPAQGAGAASHLQVASGLFTLALAAGLYVLA